LLHIWHPSDLKVSRLKKSLENYIIYTQVTSGLAWTVYIYTSDTSIKHFWKYANIKPIDSVAIDYNRRALNPIDKRANNSMNMVTKY